MRKTIAFDASKRQLDPENGYLRVSDCILTRESVDPYNGYEIPGFLDLGLDAEQIYYVYRPAEELEAALPSFEGVPLLIDHVVDSALNPKKERRVGSVMNDLRMEGGNLIGSISVQDADAIQGIENGSRVDLSSAYSFTPVLKNGEWQQIPYSIIMTGIHGNHVALVEDGRVKGAMVADENKIKRSKVMTLVEKIMDVIKNEKGVTDETEMEKREETAREEFGLNTPEEQEAYAKLDKEQDAFLAELLKLTEGARDSEEGRKSLIQDVAKLVEATGWDKAKDEEIEIEVKEDDDDEETSVIGDRKPKMKKMAFDAAALEKRVKNETVREIQARYEAAREVRHIVGDVDPFKFPDVESLYKHALDTKGIDSSKYARSAWKPMLQALEQVEHQRLGMDWKTQGQGAVSAKSELPKQFQNVRVY